ncbi:hypothetical protein KI688_005354 [Linnemannia hyalina]|uniref:PUM-HD domain-containing protein n=1 Tax=Linnemannia hyalina TaxID=64524 RepID=A0A9P8BN67_9FUNG|nr:hypothetical protein KI688_005354 [Linnemannia hyalina]
MLGNGYKERLAKAQTNIGSLLQNLPKQQSATGAAVSNPPNGGDQNEPSLGSAFFQSKVMTATGTNPISSNTPSLPPVPAPVPESNFSSRRQQQQPRTSRLPNAAFSLNRLFDGFPELNSPESNSPLLHEPGFGLPLPLPLGNISRSPSRWDAHDGSHTPISNSPRIEEQVFVPLPTTAATKTGTENLWGDVRLSTYVGSGRAVTIASTAMVGAVVVIQRAVRRFLVQKQARMDQFSLTNTTATTATKATSNDAATALTHRSNIWSIPPSSSFSSHRQSSPSLAPVVIKSAASNVDMETFQLTCLRQSTEISQLKELVTKMLLESEEDRRKLKQRDREIEELMKQQHKLTQSASLASGFDASTMNATASRFSQLTVGVGKVTAAGAPLLATSSTAPSFNTFGMAGMGMDDTSAGATETAGSIAASSALGVLADDLYESNLSYASAVGGPAAAIHPLSMPSRSNSITSLQQPSSTTSHQPNLSLKINASQSFYQQQYQGFMDMVNSPSSSDFGSQEVSTPTGYGGGRGLSQHGYGSQTSFPMLNHRSSGSFSSSRGGGVGGSAFDSPAVEQPGAYPWNVPAAGLSHSQSWADDMNAGYGYDAQTGGQYQHGAMGHSAGFDPQYINQQYAHSNQQQQPTQSTQQHQPHYRNNYRRHSDKPVHLDYQMCVDRILQATDQQASIHLQQKLKTSPPDQKLQIIDAILTTSSAYPLMSNRFGNFLIQRCFEFGSPSQISLLAQAMRGNILTLACDPFGCHVVQKALDNVEEDCKARIVTEMFRRIRETIVHRYACHVWQKVFEIRWVDAPPAVMTYVNSAVVGRWAGVAVDETGSLVVQNIFENCAEHDKRPVLNEILQSVTTIAKGQWGNWVIQHILEHGSPADRATVTQKILEDAVNLSLDQYASKVVEKTLRMAAVHSTSTAPAAATTSTTAESSKESTMTPTTPTPTSGPPTITLNNTTTIPLTQEEVMGQYIHIVSTNVNQDRPRIPLIDIAADQYGNYIIQYILTNAGQAHREMCAGLIKRHMVSLRGSKYGQKVAFMVERWRGSQFSNGGSNAGGALGQSGSSGEGSRYGSKSGSGANGMEGNGSGSGGSGGGRRNRW